MADPHHLDSWQENGLHFFVFQLRPADGTALPPTEWPVVVFTMHPDVKKPLSAVVVTPDLQEKQAVVLDLRNPEGLYRAPITSADPRSP